jgi:hypothetical protein
MCIGIMGKFKVVNELSQVSMTLISKLNHSLHERQVGSSWLCPSNTVADHISRNAMIKALNTTTDISIEREREREWRERENTKKV